MEAIPVKIPRGRASSLRVAKLNAMPPAERLFYLATGRMRIASVTQLVNGDFVRRYMARVRGLALADKDGSFLFETKADAERIGKRVMSRIRAERAGLHATAPVAGAQ
jgi:hypothetical protein